MCPEESGYYSIVGRGDDGYRIRVDEKEIISTRFAQPARTKMYDVYLEAQQEYKIEVEHFQNARSTVMQLGFIKSSIHESPEKLTGMVVEAARRVDMVILAAGFNHTKEAESYDRTFEMLYYQSKLISKIAKVNYKVVVVINSGGNVEMESWIDKVQALWHGIPDRKVPRQKRNFFLYYQSFGEITCFFFKKTKKKPAYNSYFDENKNLKTEYSEGIFIGYRAWDKNSTTPRYPFGYGLSYTVFAYTELTCDKDLYTIDDIVKVSLKVKNTGKVKGAEVIQLYVSDRESSLPRLVKKLKAFEKGELNPGEEKTVTFKLNKDTFVFYNHKIMNGKLNRVIF